MKDRASGKSRGFGFVTFWSAGDAQRVLECSHVVDGRRCEARARGGVMRASQLWCLPVSWQEGLDDVDVLRGTLPCQVVCFCIRKVGTA